MGDKINPEYYKQGKIEAIEAIEAATVHKIGIEAVDTAQVIKYLWRYEGKNGSEDIKKAQWYLNNLFIKVEEREKREEASRLVDFPIDSLSTHDLNKAYETEKAPLILKGQPIKGTHFTINSIFRSNKIDGKNYKIAYCEDERFLLIREVTDDKFSRITKKTFNARYFIWKEKGDN